jgi:hypothetical protein
LWEIVSVQVDGAPHLDVPVDRVVGDAGMRELEYDA